MFTQTINRTGRRESLDDYLRIFYNNKLSGKLINISKKGMMSVSEIPFEEKEKYSLQLMLPVSFNLTSESIHRYLHFNAVCKWSKKEHSQHSLYFSGFTISDIDNENLKLLDYLIENYKI